MKTPRNAGVPPAITPPLTIEGEELTVDRDAGAFAWRSIAAFATGLVAIAFSLVSVRAMDLIPADPLLRILQPITPALAYSTPAVFELDLAIARLVVALCGILLVVLALPWFRAARRNRLAHAGGPLLYSIAVSVSAVWTLVATAAPRALEIRAIPFDAPAASTAYAMAVVMGAQAIALSRLRRARMRLRDAGAGPETVVRDVLPEAARAGLQRARALALTAVAAAIASAAVWVFVGSLSSLPNAVVAFVAVLFAAAPVAFSLSGSLPWTAAITRAGRNGLKAVSARSLESISQSRTVVAGLGGAILSKETRVSDSAMLGVEQKELLSVAAGVELFAKHPVAAAIVQRAETLRPALPGVSEVRELPGEGAAAKLDGRTAAVGSLAMMRRLRVPVEGIEEEVHRWEAAGKTGVVIARENVSLGAIGVSHELTAGVAEAVSELGTLGMHRVVVSGSSNERTAAYAQQLGFDEYGSGDALARATLLNRQKRPVVAIGSIEDAAWMKNADARVVVGSVSHTEDADATADSHAPLASLSTGAEAARRAAAATRRGMVHATGHHVLAIPLVSGVIFPLAHWSPPSWVVWIASPIVAAAFTAVATVAVVVDRVDRERDQPVSRRL